MTINQEAMDEVAEEYEEYEVGVNPGAEEVAASQSLPAGSMSAVYI